MMMLDNDNDNDNKEIIIHKTKDELINDLCTKMQEDMIDSINNDDYIRVAQYIGLLDQAKRQDNALDKDEVLIFQKLIPMIGNNHYNILIILY